ncbi:NADH-quinone oxidoreductase subunit J [Leifsonia sp. 71-9]|uniref:NADH-quinone oxidoreductase subunit J family protein n=1 Tax=Leifsonia sp. 71-9 TaxID=1895934 RepID=UPI000925A604|nr:NADH-quinone oxidoreductase subunit J [Leifsonia sp. 71-9]OJX74522.1 MAG: NADH:ubiquinone oxidoreductase subunit J [Leifsonia sp. 71-9]
MVEAIVFGVCALGSVACGVTVFRVNSMARATFALLASFVLAAVPILLLGLSYLGVLVILMMVMEMMIMLVFMLMYMMNPAGLMPMKMVHNNRMSLVIAAVVFVVLAMGALITPWPRTGRASALEPTKDLGLDIMGPHMLVMVIIGIVLFATMVAVIVLSSARGRYDRFGDDLSIRPPQDPVKGGLGR